MVEQTLEFENAHFLLSLFAGDIDLAKKIESDFGVKVTTRDAWIKFTGDEEAVSKAIATIKDLESARRDGAEIKLKSCNVKKKRLKIYYNVHVQYQSWTLHLPMHLKTEN